VFFVVAFAFGVLAFAQSSSATSPRVTTCPNKTIYRLCCVGDNCRKCVYESSCSGPLQGVYCCLEGYGDCCGDVYSVAQTGCACGSFAAQLATNWEDFSEWQLAHLYLPTCKGGFKKARHKVLEAGQ